MAEFDIKFSGYQGPRSIHNRAVQVFGDSLPTVLVTGWDSSMCSM